MRNKLATFLRLPRRDYLLLCRAILQLTRARLELWLLPFSRINVPGGARKQPVCHASARKIGWGVNVCATFVPASTCLVRAIAAQRLLTQSGHVSDIRIGVANSARTGFKAHAWIEHRGEVIVGRSDDRYTPLVNLNTWSVPQ